MTFSNVEHSFIRSTQDYMENTYKENPEQDYLCFIAHTKNKTAGIRVLKLRKNTSDIFYWEDVPNSCCYNNLWTAKVDCNELNNLVGRKVVTGFIKYDNPRNDEHLWSLAETYGKLK